MVQLYVRALDPRFEAPLKQLRGFDRISLEPGQRRQVRFTLTPSKDLSQYDAERQAFIAQPGEYEIQIGASSQDVRLTKRVQVR
ncbi:MAG: fibronectin type III-like domain-contianing protein [Vicinamibacteraceae bacterium]